MLVLPTKLALGFLCLTNKQRQTITETRNKRTNSPLNQSGCSQTVHRLSADYKRKTDDMY